MTATATKIVGDNAAFAEILDAAASLGGMAPVARQDDLPWEQDHRGGRFLRVYDPVNHSRVGTIHTRDHGATQGLTMTENEYRGAVNALLRSLGRHEIRKDNHPRHQTQENDHDCDD